MEVFYKKNYKKLKKIDCKNENLDFQIIEWHAKDESDGSDDGGDDDSSDDDNNVECKEKYVIRCFGTTSDGHSVTCKINNFTPFYYIKIDDNFKMSDKSKFLSYIESSYMMNRKNKDGEYHSYYGRCLLKDQCVVVKKKDLYGFNNGKVFSFLRIVFNNFTAMNKSKYMFKKPVCIINSTPVKYKLYESNFEPFMRFCHIQNILMAGWISLEKGTYTKSSNSATTQIEVEIHWKKIKGYYENNGDTKKDVGNFLQASWDIETYSDDGSFPDPNKHDKKNNTFPNVIYQIATTFKYYKEDTFLVKHLLTLKKCERIDQPDVIVDECETESELIKKWVILISKMDPDIMYTYNGDTFDCMYLYERAKLHGLENFLKSHLSRLANIPTEVKNDTFSSSAYGDSDFVRFYIPGRLNYDLLIHYKRGMKKYPSYKLDYIANVLLGQGKNDISPKQIFKYYELGTPDKIKEIALYCIVDTELLQKLVDKQTILITIIQLANVTFVPISFLTTRGQTIKVFSQLLRMSKKMGYLVPHTNFNEDSYPIIVHAKEPHGLDLTDVGKYITLSIDKGVNGKITEIKSEDEFIVNSDIELQKDYLFIKFKFGKYGKDYTAKKVCPIDDAFDDSFTGATVLEPSPGFYKENIGVLDFASLYPTIMISRNLCYSTFVFDDRYLNIKGVDYENIKWDDKIEYKLKHTCGALGKTGKSKGQVCGKPAFFEIHNALIDGFEYFCRIHDPLKKTRSSSEKFQKKDVSYDYNIVQPSRDENGNLINVGVLPALLDELYAERKKVKKLMAIASANGNKLEEDILNSTQLAIKLSLNSTYGFLGRGQGNLILKELGSIVTAVGRKLIESSKEYSEGPFIDYVRENNLLKHTIKEINIDEMTKEDKYIILQQFKI